MWRNKARRPPWLLWGVISGRQANPAQPLRSKGDPHQFLPLRRAFTRSVMHHLQ